MTETTALRRSKTPLCAAVLALAVAGLVGCAPADPQTGDRSPGDEPYLVEFEPEPARSATPTEGELLSSPDRVNGAAVLSEDGTRFTVIRTDSPDDSCSEAPIRLMVVDPTTILVTYRFLGEPGQLCSAVGTTRVDEFEVPPGIEPRGVEVRTANEATLPAPLAFDAAPATDGGGGANVEFPSLNAFELLSSAISTPEESATVVSTDPYGPVPAVISHPDGSFSVVRTDSADPCGRMPAELVALSASEVAVHYRFLGEPGQDCGLEQIDRTDTFSAPAGVTGAVAVSIAFEYPKYRPIVIEQLPT
ncbi:hypothetical protein C5E06_01545 [Pseudoclavibacter sp. RFBI5]|uniref:hypothetical protein n=1 Tax=Pseudoclavibacter sp. RFBI5 TaxID=2080578 RepID=UPI000CE8E4C0|nr:hypothetical protein [Pseudoclavibacter sp. RFBI5]PPG05574.1 hypothetical protein C5E06_01545 [Pseudoclavibacter sp. RFBI5]